MSVCGKGGNGGAGNGGSAGSGGSAASSVGTTKNAGGAGANPSSNDGGAGGGSAGPNGAGGNGSGTTGGTGDNTHGGIGGIANNAGANGTEFDSTHGSGGGGGGGSSADGGIGGHYGAGGGGGAESNHNGGSGYQGVIVITYTPLTYGITASASTGGTVTPSGVTTLNAGSNQAYTITPSTGYIVSAVSVDAASQGTINSYTFSNIAANHTITASFDSGWSAPSTNTNNVSVTNASSAYTSNDGYAVFDDQNDQVDYGNFGLSIPNGAIINGIEVAAEANRTSPRIVDVSLSYDGGAHFTSPQAVGSTLSTSDKTVILGGTSNTWGHTWSSSQFANGTFKVRVAAQTTGPGDTLNLDELQVKVFYTNGDSVPPQVTTSHIQSSNATTNLAKVGDTVTVTFTASEAVRTPSLSIAGHSVAVATTSGNSFTGSYVMQNTDATGNVGVNLSLTDLAGNVMATPATVTTDSSTVTFDKTAPTITSITSTQANGSYPASTVIPVSVAFSEVVTVTGTPTLVLNDGGTATYQSGSGTNTLVYSYTVSSGENTSDLTVSSAAGSVADVTGNVANMTLPVGANLGNNSNIVIDTTAPTVALSTSVSTPTNASPFTVTVTFSEPVSGFDLTDVTVGGVDGTTLGNLQTSDNTTFTFEVTPGAEGRVLLTVHAAAASDAASNLNSAQSNTLDITYDTTVPALEITSGPSDPINTDEDVASFAFTTDGTVISCSIDGTATTSSCASPFSVGGSSGALTEGTHVFYVESKDDAGNTALATRSFTVDLTAPTIDAMSDISVTATSPSGAAITYTVPTGHDNIDDAVVVTCDIATSTTLAMGDHVVTCSTHDKAGNTPKSRIFHIYVNDLDGGQFTGIDSDQPAATADGTYQHGWHWTLKFKLPFGETKFKMKWSDFSSGSDTVTADNIRFCSEQSDMDCSDDSHYMTITASSTMSSAITLSDDADNAADGRQVEIRVEVKVPPTTVPGSYSASYQASSDTVAPPVES